MVGSVVAGGGVCWIPGSAVIFPAAGKRSESLSERLANWKPMRQVGLLSVSVLFCPFRSL